MYCPNRKCRGVRLQTTRTFDNGSTTKREKFCPKCKERFRSIEMSERDYQQTIDENIEVAREADARALAANEKYESLREAVRVLIGAASENRKTRGR
jgi:transcriptional regulator NrdR family protein